MNMDVTIADIMRYHDVSGMELIAGESGLDRVITKCGVLDYEFDPNMKKKYLYTNFVEGQFVLTSLLFAKDNEHLVFDSLKHLINKKVSGLVIKNVFRVPFSERLLNYADSKNFPIFLIKDPALYFEDIIVSVTDCIRNLSSIRFGEMEVDTILNGSLDDNAVVQHALQINYSFRPNHLAIYFRPKNTISSESYMELLNQFKSSSIYSSSDSLFRYRNGLMFIHSCETFHSDSMKDLISDYISSIAEKPNEYFIGVSDLHYTLSGMKNALEESIHAAVMHRNDSETYQLYQDLGVYQIIIPFIEDQRLRKYSNKVMEQLIDYDAENKTKLAKTAIQFISCEGNIQKLAQMLAQHENTIRYHLDKIRNVTGLDIRQSEQNDQLSITVKIHICRNLFQEFHRDN
jgi:hypothetical protein